MSQQSICFQCLRSPSTDESDFQRCGRCRARHYCSSGCQKLDWTVGEHKRNCQAPPSNPSSNSIKNDPTADILGVRLPCTKEGRSPRPNPIPSTHQMFNRNPLPLTVLLEIPLVIHRTGTSSPDLNDLNNSPATYLAINPTSGYAPEQWLSEVGTCIVARKDKRPIHACHVEALYEFVDALLDEVGNGGPEAARKKMTRAEFEAFWQNLRRKHVEEKEEGWESWRDAKDVYEG